MQSATLQRVHSPGGSLRVYPNLNPAAAIPVERDQIFHLNSFYDNYRLFRGKERSQYVPNSRYVFVRTTGGETLLHPRFRHPALAQGRPVLYAGEAQFDNGRLLWWSNGSGNYRPDAAHATQADLPMDQFFPYEDILKGVHSHAAHQKTGSLQAKMFARRYPAGILIPAWGRRA
jgi:hypothetical protein